MNQHAATNLQIMPCLLSVMGLRMDKITGSLKTGELYSLVLGVGWGWHAGGSSPGFCITLKERP